MRFKFNEKFKSGSSLILIGIMLILYLKPGIKSFVGFASFGLIVSGLFVLFSKKKKFVRSSKLQKKKLSLIGGVSGLVIGYWMIFFKNDIFGFIPSLIGLILLTRRIK